jgi:hypothetical protein
MVIGRSRRTTRAVSGTKDASSKAGEVAGLRREGELSRTVVLSSLVVFMSARPKS